MSVHPKDMKLDAYEQKIEDNFDPTVSYAPETVAAKNYLKKDKRITIRVYSGDLEQIKQLASEEGLPYQTFITSILHKFSTGRFRDIK